MELKKIIKISKHNIQNVKIQTTLLLIAFNGFLGSVSAAPSYRARIYEIVGKAFYGYAKPTVIGMSFIFIFWDLYQGFNKKNDKQTHWWAVGLALMFIFFLGVFPAIFNSLFGTDISETDIGGF